MNKKNPVTIESEIEWNRFIKILEEAAQSEQLESLLELILTPDERLALPNRLLIVKALLLGELTQRELKEHLGTGIATITRGSNSLKYISPEFREWLQQRLFKNITNHDER